MGFAAKGAAAAAAVTLATVVAMGSMGQGQESTMDDASLTSAAGSTTRAVQTARKPIPKPATKKPVTKKPVTKKPAKKATPKNPPVKKTVAKATRLTAWEKQVLAGAQQARAKKRIRPMRGNACLNGVAVAMAQRVGTNARAARTTDWTSADTTRLMRCTSAANKIHADAVWESNRRTPAQWVASNYAAGTVHVNSRWREVGVGSFKDRNGRAHVVLVQMYVTKR